MCWNIQSSLVGGLSDSQNLCFFIFLSILFLKLFHPKWQCSQNSIIKLLWIQQYKLSVLLPLFLCLGILKMAVSFTTKHRHRAMKWDLFEQIVNKEGCLCMWPSAKEQNIWGVSFPPTASPLTVLWTPSAKDTRVLNSPDYSTEPTLSLPVGPN